MLSHKEFVFSDSYKETNWKKLIGEAENSIVICVYYWDKWVKEHEDLLFKFLKKPQATLQFYFSSSYSDILRLFPKNSLDDLKQKISRTYEPLMDFIETHDLPKGKVKVNFIPYPLNYSFQCFDDRILIISFFEMYRSIQVDAPSIQVDLNETPNTKRFYLKEIQGLKAFSETNDKQDLWGLKAIKF